jgi:hypothetical protein
LNIHVVRGDGGVVGWGSTRWLGADLSPLHLERTQVPVPCRLTGLALGETKRCGAQQ